MSSVLPVAPAEPYAPPRASPSAPADAEPFESFLEPATAVQAPSPRSGRQGRANAEDAAGNKPVLGENESETIAHLLGESATAQAADAADDEDPLAVLAVSNLPGVPQSPAPAPTAGELGQTPANGFAPSQTAALPEGFVVAAPAIAGVQPEVRSAATAAAAAPVSAPASSPAPSSTPLGQVIAQTPAAALTPAGTTALAATTASVESTIGGVENKSTPAANTQAAPGTAAPANTNPPAAANAPALPAQVEALNAAVLRHLPLGEANASATETQTLKPLLSSNAVAPNFAASVQAQAPAEAAQRTASESVRAVPLEALAVEIAARAKGGQRHFEIRLDPPELGKIEIRIETDTKGNTSTRLVAERPETLDLLQRDARGLEKALQTAGLKLESGGLSFSLRQDAAQTPAQYEQASNRPIGAANGEIAEPITLNANANAYLAAKIRGGVDIRI